ncbi:hypothetical protein DFJ73DRAFT_759623 [Zopfochytrium polystomum]|nr:hypothetical protein DFJ73DRAFT_759623 [Zopfochytrium polystomum]
MRSSAATTSLALFLIALIASSVAGSSDGSKHSLQVLHAINDGPFSPRGVINFNPAGKRGQKYEPAAANALADKLAKVAAPTDFYLLQFVGKLYDHDVVLNATARLCQLQAAKFRESITIHLDESGGNWASCLLGFRLPYHIDYIVPSHECTDKVGFMQLPQQAPKVVPFQTSVGVVNPQAGVRPRLEQIVSETKDGKPQPQPSFLQKYWYYLIPIGLAVIMNIGAEPEGPAK